MEFEHYTIEELKPGLFAMDDENGDSLYLIVGEEKALLIDTGLMREDIMPMLKSLTDKPIELALTHAHIDHMYHAPEFATVYLHEADIEAWRKGILRVLMLAGFQMFHVPYRKFHTAHGILRLQRAIALILAVTRFAYSTPPATRRVQAFLLTKNTNVCSRGMRLGTVAHPLGCGYLEVCLLVPIETI